MTSGAKLAGKRILVVEDQYMIADDLAQLFTELGGVVIGPYASSAAARAGIANADIDLAILDVALAGNAVYPLAEELQARSVPFLFLTGFSGDSIRNDFSNAPILVKPYSNEALLALIRRLGWLGA